MKKLLAAFAVVVAAGIGWRQFDDRGLAARTLTQESQTATDAFNERSNGVQVHGEGIVIKILPDDNEGNRHQRFILRLPTGQTLLIAHNIDLAPSVSSLSIGDTVAFYGEYAWNAKGGVVHWTHRDPNGHHVAGWLKHKGRMYQ